MPALRNRVRAFNKRTLNPWMLRFAGKKRGSFAVISHRGRKSGKTYTTPIIVQPVTGGFVIALTYGPEVDWYRNLQAAGQGTLLWQNQEYAISQPETLAIETALKAFPFPFGPLLRLFGTRHFIKIASVPLS